MQQRKTRILKQTERREQEEFRAVSGYHTKFDRVSKECSYDDEDNIEIEFFHEQNRHSLKFLAQTCDRYGISGRAGTCIANAILRDYGLLLNNPHDVIAPCKLLRER